MRRILTVLLTLGPLAIVLPLVPLVRFNGSNPEHGLRVHVGEGVAGSLSGKSMIHDSDDFILNDIGASQKWEYVGENPLSFVPSRLGHQGIISIPTGTTTSVNELIGNQVCAGPSANFSGISKCVARFVVSCDALYAGSGGFDGEWFMGIANPDGKGNVYAGADRK